MTEIIEIDSLTNKPYKKYVPILTGLICVISVGLFIGINLDDDINQLTLYKRWGAPSILDLFDGSYWGLITANFLHKELWHIVFNLYWIWLLGKKIEFESSKVFYIMLVVSSAWISSTAQLSFSYPGIGLSGIAYAFFGFIYVKSKTAEEYREFLDKRTVNMFLIWLVVCIVLTEMNILLVGNAAHIGGLLWGMTLAYILKFSTVIQVAIRVLLLTLITFMVFWTPFSAAYLSHKAYSLHLAQKFDEAIPLYKQILERDPDSEFAIQNLNQLELYKLSQKALKLHQDKKYAEARHLYEEILRLDNGNAWARENLKLIPDEEALN